MTTQVQPSPTVGQVAIGLLVALARSLPGADTASWSFLDTVGVPEFQSNLQPEDQVDVLGFLTEHKIDPRAYVAVAA